MQNFYFDHRNFDSVNALSIAECSNWGSSLTRNLLDYIQVNVLLQAYISQLKLEGFALMSDMVYVTQVCMY
jgi:hypothetical protein